tara:strand:+ start:15403 stop:15882 length:480 start_codon:yes stop_codon:yes gene_type:complete
MLDLVLAEIKPRRVFTTNRVFHELLVTRTAQIVSAFLEFIPELIRVYIAKVFQQFVNFHEVISIIVEVIEFFGFHYRLNFEIYHIPNVRFRIDRGFTTVAGVMNHLCVFQKKRGYHFSKSNHPCCSFTFDNLIVMWMTVEIQQMDDRKIGLQKNEEFVT